jgi:hypothetical protein
MKTRPIFIALLVTIIAPADLPSQYGGPAQRRFAVLSGGRISTVFGNWGVIGQPAAAGPRGAWKQSTNGYIGDLSLLVGVELPIRDYNGDSLPDTVHSVITCPVSRPTTLPDTDPVSGQYLTFEPDTGYFNPASSSVALSDDPTTWPSVWPDHPAWGPGVWNGLFGPDSFAGDHEAYYRMSDNNDYRFNVASKNPLGISFHPDTTDLARTGQGISVAVRYIVSDSLPFRDALFRVYDITNASSWRYERVFLGALCGTYVGVTGIDNAPQEYDDDASIFYRSTNVIQTWDFDNNASRNPSWVGPVGRFGETFLQTPATPAIGSYYAFTPSIAVSLGDDQWLWNALKPGTYVNPSTVQHDTIPAAGADMDYLYATQYFSLDPGETRRVVSVIAYGMNRSEVEQNVQNALMLWNARFDHSVVREGVQFTNFSSHRLLRGTVAVQWSTLRPGGSVDLWYRRDPRASWQQIASSLPNTGAYSWNTSGVSDCAYGILRIVARDSAGNPFSFSITPQSFTVDNAPNGAPTMVILNDELAAGPIVADTVYTLSLLAGDPEDSLLTFTGSYRTGTSTPWTVFDTFQSRMTATPLLRQVHLSLLPNSDSFQLKYSASDGVFTVADSTGAFKKRTPRTPVPQANVTHIAGPAEVPLEVRIVNRSLVRPDTYLVTFDDTTTAGTTTFSVYNQTAGSYRLRNAALSAGIETETFDGLTLYTEHTATSYDQSRSGWNRTPGPAWSTNMFRVEYPLYPLYGYAKPDDYVVAFDSVPIDTSIALDPYFPASPIPYRVTNRRTGIKVPVADLGVPGICDLILWDNSRGTLHPTWELIVQFGSPDSVARHGDSLWVYTMKAYSYLDTLSVSGVVVSADESPSVPLIYELHQSFPNPCNPSARIRFTVPSGGRVTIELFNVLGQRLGELFNGDIGAGTHDVRFDGSRLASGVYFYRMHARGFAATRKLLLVR